MKLRISRLFGMCCLVSFLGIPAQSTLVQGGDPPADAATLWKELVETIDPLLAKSRPILLGTRSPNPSCIRPVLAGEVQDVGPKIARMGNPEGGPGTAYVALTMRRSVSTPMEDFQWHQTTLKEWLETKRNDNKPLLEGTSALAEKARRLAEGLASELPKDGLVASASVGGETWPGMCLRQLAEAIQKGDENQARHWGQELAAAMAGWADLHRWLDLLLQNHLSVLAFQSACQGVFEACEKIYEGKYNPKIHIGRFPGGNETLYGADNYLEVERQAEILFAPPESYRQTPPPSHPSAYAIPPDLREVFLDWRNRLPASHQALLEKAARMPFERSFLVNILFRAQQGKYAESVGEILKRFGAQSARKEATVEDLMDILPYRGAFFAGMEWPDRYDPRLLKMSESIPGDCEKSLKEAHRLTSTYYGGQHNYVGLILTLRESLDTHKMDCIRATDFIAALYRNAATPGFRKVRQFRGGSGHTIAAAKIPKGKKSEILLADGLVQGTPNLHWPDAFFRAEDTYAVMLYGRGLDSYLFLQGYFIHGPSAGELWSVAVPYIAGQEKETREKVNKAAIATKESEKKEGEKKSGRDKKPSPTKSGSKGSSRP